MIVRRLRRISVLLTFLLLGVWSADMLTRPSSFTDVIIKSNPGIVQIQVDPKLGVSSGLAGFVVSGEGHILTVAHGFSRNSKTDKIKVYLWKDYEIPYEAKLLRISHKLDIALIQVPNLPKDVPVLHIGKTLVGQEVVAIGHPSYFPYTATEGMVTGVRSQDKIPVLQFSAALNPGNSGGPVLNRKGEVVGMSFYILHPGISLAVPSVVLRAYIRNIPTGGPYENLYEVSNAFKQAFQNTGLLPRRKPQGSKK